MATLTDALRASVNKLDNKTENSFSDDRIESMFIEFNKRAKDGRLARADFAPVLAALFEDPEAHQCALILCNDIFLDRMFSFCDTERKGSVTHEQLSDGVGVIFSADDHDDARFYFHAYDVAHKGYIEHEGMLKVLRSWLDANLTVQERELRKQLAAGLVEQDTLDVFLKAKAVFLEKNATDLLSEIVGWAFSSVVGANPQRITFDEFKVGLNKNFDFFDWKGATEDLMDKLDDLSKTLA